MSLATIIDAVLEDLETVQPGVSSKLGGRFVASNVEKVPRLVWVPQTETFDAPWNISANPRQLFTRNARVMVHVQGGDPDRTGDIAPTETLVHRLIGALYRVCHGYMQIGTGQWPSEDGSTANAGPLYLLEVTFGIPVADELVESVTIASVEQTNVGVLPGGDAVDFVATTPKP